MKTSVHRDTPQVTGCGGSFDKIHSISAKPDFPTIGSCNQNSKTSKYVSSAATIKS